MNIPNERNYQLDFYESGIHKQATGQAYETSATELLYEILSCSGKLPVTVAMPDQLPNKRSRIEAAGFLAISVSWHDIDESSSATILN